MTAVLFVAGTDTGVGKTHVARALCTGLRARGLRVGVFKPAETGCLTPAQAADALALREAAGCTSPLETVCPYRLEAPLAPAVAAKRQGVTIDPALLDRCLASLRATHDVVVCEGAGGLLVPLAEGMLNADWIESRRLPVLLVGRLGLGTLNHVLLSVHELQRRGVPLVGTVLSPCSPGKGLAESTNPEVLSGFPEARFLGVATHSPFPTLPEAVFAAVWPSLGR